MDKTPHRNATSPWPEKLAGAIGLLLTLAVAGYLFYLGITTDGAPDLHITGEAVTKQQDGWLIEIALENSGGHTAQEVVVEGRLLDIKTGTPVEMSEISFDYVPARSAKHGGLIFMHDPAAYRLELKAKGFISP